MRIYRRSFCAGLLAGCVSYMAGCKSTSLSTTWRDPAAPPVSFTKVVVVVLNSTPAERRSQEEALVGQIKQTTAIASYTFIPDDQLKDADGAKMRIIASGVDGAVILRLVESDQHTTYVPPTATMLEDAWASADSYQVHPGYSVTDTIIRAEVSLHSVPDGKLIWAGASETINPRDAKSLATEVAQAAVAELRRQKLLR